MIDMTIILVIIVTLIYGSYMHWKGYQKGYNNAKKIYNETCGPEEFKERLNEN